MRRIVLGVEGTRVGDGRVMCATHATNVGVTLMLPRDA